MASRCKVRTAEQAGYLQDCGWMRAAPLLPHQQHRRRRNQMLLLVSQLRAQLMARQRHRAFRLNFWRHQVPSSPSVACRRRIN
eukprot:3049915-Pleurochrysis_carterae.AAC.2